MNSVEVIALGRALASTRPNAPEFHPLYQSWMATRNAVMAVITARYVDFDRVRFLAITNNLDPHESTLTRWRKGNENQKKAENGSLAIAPDANSERDKPIY